MNVIAEHLRSNEPSLVIWLAFSDELCEQAVEEFEQAWGYLGNRPINVYRFWGASGSDLQAARDGFVVAGLGKMYNYGMRSLSLIATLADRTSLVVIDEAHQSVAPTYGLVLDTLVEKQPTTGLLGLSATPGRTWSDVDEDQTLADFFRRQKVSLEVEGFPNPVEYLVVSGYLARPVFFVFVLQLGRRPLYQRLGRYRKRDGHSGSHIGTVSPGPATESRDYSPDRADCQRTQKDYPLRGFRGSCKVVGRSSQGKGTRGILDYRGHTFRRASPYHQQV